MLKVGYTTLRPPAKYVSIYISENILAMFVFWTYFYILQGKSNFTWDLTFVFSARCIKTFQKWRHFWCEGWQVEGAFRVSENSTHDSGLEIAFRWHLFFQLRRMCQSLFDKHWQYCINVLVSGRKSSHMLYKLFTSNFFYLSNI